MKESINGMKGVDCKPQKKSHENHLLKDIKHKDLHTAELGLDTQASSCLRKGTPLSSLIV